MLMLTLSNDIDNWSDDICRGHKFAWAEYQIGMPLNNSIYGHEDLKDPSYAGRKLDSGWCSRDSCLDVDDDDVDDYDDEDDDPYSSLHIVRSVSTIRFLSDWSD